MTAFIILIIFNKVVKCACVLQNWIKLLELCQQIKLVYFSSGWGLRLNYKLSSGQRSKTIDLESLISVWICWVKYYYYTKRINRLNTELWMNKDTLNCKWMKASSLLLLQFFDAVEDDVTTSKYYLIRITTLKYY